MNTTRSSGIFYGVDFTELRYLEAPAPHSGYFIPDRIVSEITPQLINPNIPRFYMPRPEPKMVPISSLSELF